MYQGGAGEVQAGLMRGDEPELRHADQHAPIHVAGTLIISNSAVEQQEALFRRLLTLGVCLAVITPGLMARAMLETCG
jgi:hypothetical protein